VDLQARIDNHDREIQILHREIRGLLQERQENIKVQLRWETQSRIAQGEAFVKLSHILLFTDLHIKR